MARTIVIFRDREFWPKSGILQLWMAFVAREIDKIPRLPPWLVESRNWWQAFADEKLNEFADLRLDEFVNSDDRADLVLSCAKRALETLRRVGPIVTKDAIAEILTVRPEDAGWGSNPSMPTEWISEVGEVFLELLGGEVEAPRAKTRGRGLNIEKCRKLTRDVRRTKGPQWSTVVFRWLSQHFRSNPVEQTALSIPSLGRFHYLEDFWESNIEKDGTRLTLSIAGDSSGPFPAQVEQASTAVTNFADLKQRVAGALQSELESFPVGRPEDFQLRGLCFLWPNRPEYFVVELGLEGDEHGIWRLEFEGDKLVHWSRDD